MAKQRQDKTVTDPFPTMGKGGPPTRVAPVTSNLMLTPKKGAEGSARAYGMLDGVMAIRPHIQERMGAQLRISATLYKANAAEAGATGRNVRLMPTAIGNRDFYSARRNASL